MSPKVTVVTVVRNAVKTIEQTMLSVLNQTYSNIEYIIVDGVSTDGTKEIITNYELRITAGEFPNIVSFKFISEPDKGIYDAMNKGIDMAEGEWIIFLGGDDILLYSFSEVCKKMIDQQCVYYCNAFYTKDEIVFNGKYNKLKISISNINHQTIFYPKHIITKEKFNIQYPVLADYHLNIKLFAVKGIRFQFIDRVICIFNQQGASQSIVDTFFLSEKFNILKNNFGLSYAIFEKVYIVAKNTIRPLKKIITK